jgi:UPF0042 nucleotide-binding protein
MTTTEKPHLILLAPVGAARTDVLESLSSFGYLVVGNLPPETALESLASLTQVNGPVAASFRDVMGPDDATRFADTLAQLSARIPNLQILLLTAPVPLRQQKLLEEGQAHPLALLAASAEDAGAPQPTLEALLLQEQAIYDALKPLAQYHLDLGAVRVEELPNRMARILGLPPVRTGLTVVLKSFGFKQGAPTDAELLFDMRFLHNPFYEPHLRPLTGLDAPVRDYVFSRPGAQTFFDQWTAMLSHLLPLYQAEGKLRLTIGIGCTGGQHRSVCMTEALAAWLRSQQPEIVVEVQHREASHWALNGRQTAEATAPAPPLALSGCGHG